MYIFLLYASISELAIVKYSKEEIEFEPISEDGNNVFEKNEINSIKLRLMKAEIDEFVSSLKRIDDQNKMMIYHVENLQITSINDENCINSLKSLKKFTDYLSETRKNSENYHVCEYEFFKFCELFYLILFYIFENEKEMFVSFLKFSMQKLLPIFKKLRVELRISKIYRFFDSIVERFNFRKTRVKDRRSSIINFISKFVQNQHEIISVNEIDENFTSNSLLKLSLNVFIRYYLCHVGRWNEFCEDFISQNYLISDQFEDFLFTAGKITGIVLVARITIRRFLLQNNLRLDVRFIEQGIIPHFSDMLNKYVQSLGLTPIDYENDDNNGQ